MNKNYTVDFVTISGKSTNRIDTIKVWAAKPGAKIADSVTFPNGKAVIKPADVEEEAEKEKPTPKVPTLRGTTTDGTLPQFEIGGDIVRSVADPSAENGWMMIPEVKSLSSMESFAASRTSLKTIDFSDVDLSNVSSLRQTFKGCTSLEGDIYLPDVNKWCQQYEMFGDCTNIKSVSLKIQTNGSGADMFHNCTSLESIDFRDSLFGSDWYAVTNFFRGCTSLTSVKVGGISFSEGGVSTLINWLNSEYGTGKTTWHQDGDYLIP